MLFFIKMIESYCIHFSIDNKRFISVYDKFTKKDRIEVKIHWFSYFNFKLQTNSYSFDIQKLQNEVLLKIYIGDVEKYNQKDILLFTCICLKDKKEVNYDSSLFQLVEGKKSKYKLITIEKEVVLFLIQAYYVYNGFVSFKDSSLLPSFLQVKSKENCSTSEDKNLNSFSTQHEVYTKHIKDLVLFIEENSPLHLSPSEMDYISNGIQDSYFINLRSYSKYLSIFFSDLNITLSDLIVPNHDLNEKIDTILGREYVILENYCCFCDLFN